MSFLLVNNRYGVSGSLVSPKVGQDFHLLKTNTFNTAHAKSGTAKPPRLIRGCSVADPRPLWVLVKLPS
jgi:hypothetical protein